MLPLLAMAVVVVEMGELAAGMMMALGAVKLLLDTVEVAQRVHKAAREARKSP